MTGTEWNTKEEKIQQDSLWTLEPKETHQITGSQYRTDTENIKRDKLIELCNTYYSPKRNKYKSRGDSFWAKQTDTETPEDHWKKLIELEKECDFPEFSEELLISKFITSITDKKLRAKLSNVVEQIQQNAYDRKNKKNNIQKPQYQTGKKTSKKSLYTE